MIELAIPAFLGFLARVKGGLFKLKKTTYGRLAWTTGLYLASLLFVPFIWQVAILQLGLIYAGISFVGHGIFMTMGRTPNQTKPLAKSGIVAKFLGKIFKPGTVKGDIVGMGVIGLIRHLWIVPTIFVANAAVVYLLGGLLYGFVYYLAWMIPSKIKGAKQGTELAEILVGVLNGLLLIVVALLA